MKLYWILSVLSVLLIVLHHVVDTVAAVRWLSLATLSTTDRRQPSHQNTAPKAKRQKEQPKQLSHQLRSNDVTLTSAVTAVECDKFVGLTARQRRVCRRDVDNMRAVRQGAQLAIDECQYQFQRRRWNCSVIDPINVFGKVVATGTREAAFVHAIASAGVVYAVTRSCSSGQLDRCGCDRTVKVKPQIETKRRIRSGAAERRDRESEGEDSEDDGEPYGTGKFHWSGCSDNIEYGVAFARSFIDSSELTNRGNRTDRTLVNLHNNDAGRKAVSDNIRLRCKCHGVSGSCEVRTCWRTVPSMRHVGDILLEMYDTAAQVSAVKSEGSVTRLERSPGYMLLMMHRTGHRVASASTRVTSSGLPSSKSPRGLPTAAVVNPISPSELVYLEASPDFCDADERTGTSGTVGRRCNATVSGLSSSGGVADTYGCDVMCCGRGFVTERRTVVEKCRCRFHWCCAVRCERCKTTVIEHVCR